MVVVVEEGDSKDPCLKVRRYRASVIILQRMAMFLVPLFTLIWDPIRSPVAMAVFEGMLDHGLGSMFRASPLFYEYLGGYGSH